MKLTDLLKKEMIVPELKGEGKEDVINELIDLFKNDPRVDDIEKVRAAVMARENIMSTGVGKNFAIPHGKTDAVDDVLCAFGKTTREIEYQSLDNQPVHLLFLLVGKENQVSLHIKLLSRISRMMTRDDFRTQLLEAKTQDEIFELFKQEEESFFDL